MLEIIKSELQTKPVEYMIKSKNTVSGETCHLGIIINYNKVYGEYDVKPRFPDATISLSELKEIVRIMEDLKNGSNSN